MPIQPKRLVRPDQVAGTNYSERAFFIFSFFLSLFIFIYFFNMKPFLLEMACFSGIQDEIQAVCLKKPLVVSFMQC